MKTFILAFLASVALIALTPIVIFILLVGAVVFSGIDTIREYKH